MLPIKQKKTGLPGVFVRGLAVTDWPADGGAEAGTANIDDVSLAETLGNFDCLGPHE